MQKYLKNNKGFTLVEVIVVAVIVLILAAVAIPLYQGYVLDSKQATAENLAGSVAAAISSGIQTGALPINATSGVLGTPVAVGVTGVTPTFSNIQGADGGFITFASKPSSGADPVSLTIPKGYNVNFVGNGGFVTVVKIGETDIDACAAFHTVGAAECAKPQYTNPKPIAAAE